jgi:hypothetical protein
MSEARRDPLISMQVAVLELEDLVEPVGHLHVRVAPQLAEHGGALQGLVPKGIEFAEQLRTVDLGHFSFLYVGLSVTPMTYAASSFGTTPKKGTDY